MRLDRMLAITLELMTKKRIRASEIASRFEVSTRTIYRDIELINQAGIPVTSFTGADGGFELMDGFFMSKQHFTVEDFSVIYQLLQSLEEAMGNQYTQVKHKLASLHPNVAMPNQLNDNLIRITSTKEEAELVRKINQAVKRSLVITFTYVNATGDETERRVEPNHLFWEGGAWYLEGYCLNKNANRMFRVSRMSNLRLTEESFRVREEQAIGHIAPSEGYQAHLRFELTAQPRVYEQFRDECQRFDDRIEVRTTFYHLDYALSVILSYGSKVMVLSPPELKDALLEEIEHIKKRYTD